MSSPVDICNLALGHLGDTATVASLDPPEGSAQAEHCARFYVIARDTLLEMHPWNFATKRVTPPQLTSGWTVWDFSYAMPSDALVIRAVQAGDVQDDYSTGSAYVPVPYACEIDNTGARVVLTDQEGAVLRYTARVEDTTKFSPLFVLALSWHLASMLAGPIIKGDAGAAEAKRCVQMMQGFLAKATTSDANQRDGTPQQVVSWIGGR
jgi:hypothetical protein